jgi:hypothetical protein
MQKFFVRLQRSGYYGSAALTLPQDLQLLPISWTAGDRGGCREAIISASGSAESLASLATWLGDRVEINNEMGELVWWGDLWDMELNLGNVIISLSMDNIYNRVAVTYPFMLPDGSEESRTTSWVSDQVSIDRYGVRELLYGLPENLSLSAEEVRNQILKQRSQPDPIITTSVSGQFSARLTAQGAWAKADSVYFTNLNGLHEHTEYGGLIRIGMYMSSTDITFGTAHDEEDEMYIGNPPGAAGANFPFRPKETVTVSGSKAVGNGGKTNNNSYIIDKMDQPWQIGITGSFVAEARGNPIKITAGDDVSYLYLAQSFKLPTSWTVTHVAIMCCKVGNPTDNLRVSIYPDAGGVPGTFLSYIEIPESSLYTEQSWMEWPLTTPVTLAANVTYYLGVRRTGGPDLANGYEISIDDQDGYADGNLIVSDGAGWTDVYPGEKFCDMPFRLIGEIKSTAQMSKVLDMIDAFPNYIILVDSGMMVRQFQEEEVSAQEKLVELLDMGMANGTRLIAWVDKNRTLLIDTQVPDSYGQQNLLYGSDGKLKYGNGSLYTPGRLVYGQAVDIESLMLFNSVGLRTTRGPSIYIKESSYEATDDAINLMSEGAQSPFDALKARKG